MLPKQTADIETAYRAKINLRPAVLCKHRCEECRFCTFSGDEDGGEYVWCRHPHTLSLPDFFNIMEENIVCDLFEPCPLAQTIGFKAGQSADGGIGDEREVSQTLSHKPSALKPTVAIAALLSQMRYIVRRLTPTEAERLMGLKDGWTIPKNLVITDALVAEFQRVHDAYGAIMYEYAKASYERNHREGEPPPKPPKPKSATWVRKWLEKIANPDTCPDAPRYKGVGNGWATNQPRWILLRMLAAEGIDPWRGEFDEAKEAKENSNVGDN